MITFNFIYFASLFRYFQRLSFQLIIDWNQHQKAIAQAYVEMYFHFIKFVKIYKFNFGYAFVFYSSLHMPCEVEFYLHIYWVENHFVSLSMNVYRSFILTDKELICGFNANDYDLDGFSLVNFISFVSSMCIQFVSVLCQTKK